MKTYAEQIRDLKATVTVKAERLQAIMNKASEEGRSLDVSEAEEFDTIEGEIKTLSADVSRLERLQTLTAGTAQPVTGATQKAASESRAVTGAPSIIVNRRPDEKFKGQNFVRRLIAKTLGQIDGVSAIGIAQRRFRDNPELVELIKADVAGGGSATGEWGAELVQADARYTGDFIEYLNGLTVYDRLGLREVPANITIKGQDGAATGYWVGEGRAIPVTAMDFSTVSLTPLKAAALAVASIEWLRDSSPSAEMLVRDALVQAAAQRIDATFLSAAAAVAGVSPAGILNGLVAGVASGTDADALRADIRALYAGFLTARNATGLAYVMNPALAKSIQLMRNALGQAEFAGITADGGTLEGDRVVTGDNVAAADFILLKPSDIWKIGDGGIQVSMSRDATIEMGNAPTGDILAPADMSENPVSMFQNESVAFKIVRSMNFARRRTSAVAYIGNAAYAP